MIAAQTLGSLQPGDYFTPLVPWPARRYPARLYAVVEQLGIWTVVTIVDTATTVRMPANFLVHEMALEQALATRLET